MQSKALPPAYIDRLFEKFLAYYGDKFVRQWSVIDAKAMKAIWAEELADLTGPEIKRGVLACREREWPPTLPEFRNLCREPLHYESAFYEAAQRFGTRTGWSSPVVYWAAASIGNDVRTHSYKAMVGRWKQAMDSARDNPQPIPEKEAPALADPYKPEPMPETVRKQFEQFTQQFGREA